MKKALFILLAIFYVPMSLLLFHTYDWWAGLWD